jgi:DNA modification methylase
VTWEIRQGDVLDRLREIPDESVQCVVTSPPYFGLRDYGVEGQIGLEATLDEYLDNLVVVFAEVRRVLRIDGTLWLNMGDSYASKPRGSDNGWDKSRLNNPARIQKAQSASLRRSRHTASAAGAKQKDLMMVPAQLALALRADGWWLREDIVWHKPTPMPEPVADRCTRAHEYLFRLTKAPRYYADQDAIREPLKPKTLTTFGTMRELNGEPVGANKRSVWTIRGTAYPEAHFATFPPELVEPCILASSSREACSTCGAPWQRMLGDPEPVDGIRPSGNGFRRDHQVSRGGFGQDDRWEASYRPTTGWEPSCDHPEGGGSSMVLDPFAGAGTTLLVAERLGRDSIGIELNAEYCDLARQRIRDDSPLLNTAAEVA